MTQPRVYENSLNWIADPAPPASHLFNEMTSPAPAPTVPTPPAEVHPRFPGHLRSRRRRRRKAAASANENSSRLVSRPATRPRSTANRNSPIPGNQLGISQPMRSTPVEHPQTFLRPQHSQSPNLRANENAERRSRLDHPEIQGLYKPARNDPREDLTVTLTRDNISGFGLSWDCLPVAARAARPDTWLLIDAALSEAAVLDRRSRPPTVLDIAETRLPENHQPQGPHLARRQTRKRRHNHSTGVYRPSKHSPPRGHWCE